MSLFSLKHSKAAYRADFLVYGAAVLTLITFLLVTGEKVLFSELVVLVALGMATWTFIEYTLHRFVMHGLQPFKRWHAEHHRRPKALIATPTIMSMVLIVTLVFLPALTLTDNLWRSCALTLGVLIGYLIYSITHHANHHWRANNAWLKQRKRWHAVHHQNSINPECFGVTSTFWDHIFRSARD